MRKMERVKQIKQIQRKRITSVSMLDDHLLSQIGNQGNKPTIEFKHLQSKIRNSISGPFTGSSKSIYG